MNILKYYYEQGKNIKNNLQELIEELKYNQNINIKNNLSNKIDIDYIINRLEDIIKKA